MKVAEALALRADLQRRLEQLKQRLVKNTRVQEGDQPEEAPEQLQTEFERCAEELVRLIRKINRTNASSRLGKGTLADALAERDVLKIRQNAYRELASAASTVQTSGSFQLEIVIETAECACSAQTAHRANV